MGAAMVPHLVKADHRVSVWNRRAAVAEALHGVEVLSSPAAAFENDVVVTMLSDDAAVRSVIIETGALASARKGCIHVVMSTISLGLVGELEALHYDAGIAYVAAPVFGVPAVAARAELNIVAAGDRQAVATVLPLFDAMGRKTWLLGEDPKRANVAKIAGNMMIALAIEAMGEASALTESYGLSARDFLEVMTNTLFTSPSYQRYGGFIANNSYEPGFKLTLGLKDVNLALDAAKAEQMALPAVEVVQQSMSKAIDAGLGAKDWSVLATMTRRRK
jgi:3-hydroxyisobutyrate dehydrogenase-like beta-hydroxyacid dehydrogenase